jgi:hypothetical protein
MNDEKKIKQETTCGYCHGKPVVFVRKIKLAKSPNLFSKTDFVMIQQMTEQKHHVLFQLFLVV